MGLVVLKQRIITALILAPLVLAGIFLLEPVLFNWFFAFIVILGAWEWANLSGFLTQPKRIIYALILSGLLYLEQSVSTSWVLHLSVMWWVIASLFVLTYPATKSYWSPVWVRGLIGVIVLLPMWKALVFIRTATFIPMPEMNSLWLIFYMMLVVWGADTGAYFAGKTWGKKKLAPNVSPGKSWAGAWGGVTATMVIAFTASLLMNLSYIQSTKFIAITLITAVVSIIGDLTESMFKRHREIKDSSQLLPGHGGVLDRIDSLVAAIPVFVFLLLYLGWVA